MKVDPGEGSGLPTIDGQTVEFDPANAILPFPNNLVLCSPEGTNSLGRPCTAGRLDIPAPACETPISMAIRTGVLNKLDGFGTYEAAMQVTFTEPVDAATLDGNIVLYQRTKGATSNDPASAMPVPVLLVKGSTLRFKAGACTTPATIDAVTIIPKVPLAQKSTYVAAVLKGLKTVDGKDYLPSFTWALVRQPSDPVTLDDQGNVTSNQTPLDPRGDANGNGLPDILELQGLDRLWKAHAQAMAFLKGAGHDYTDVLVAFDVTTQTTTDQLDPTVANSPANKLVTNPLLGTTSVVPGGGANSQAFIIAALQASGQSAQQAAAFCASAHCDKVGDILGGALATANYQTHVTNPLAGGADLPGPWSDPINPMSQTGFKTAQPAVPVGAVPFIAIIPNTAMPPSGWPVVIFGHGLQSSKETLIAIGPQLANAGFASIAIDFVDHGDRAVRTSTTASLGCADPGVCAVATTACDPTAPGGATCPAGDTCVGYSSFSKRPQCYAPFLTADLAGTRDNIRQTVLDLERLVNAVKACGTTACNAFKVDPAHITYTGISLGGIIGTTTTAIQPDFTARVLNVAAMGWVDILEHSQTLDISCPLVDALIDAGVLMGDKWNGSETAPTGLCTTNAWQMQPGYAQFSATARWILDPADGANFASFLAPKKFLLQEVVDDHVVPNYATDNEGALLGKQVLTADPFTPVTSTPSAAITTGSMLWVKYPSLPASDAATGGFGNLFEHASLLRPAVGTPPQPGHCTGGPAQACGSDADCTATVGGSCVFPGVLGTARLQTDAITYLFLNK